MGTPGAHSVVPLILSAYKFILSRLPKEDREVAKSRVSARAVIQRINRKLAPGKEVHVSRGQRLRLDTGAYYDLNAGAYYIVDFVTGCLGVFDFDLEAMARKLGVLGDFEEIAD
jgi:hypothetical protein